MDGQMMAACPGCGRWIDVTGRPGVVVLLGLDGGGAFCPDCGVFARARSPSQAVRWADLARRRPEDAPAPDTVDIPPPSAPGPPRPW